MDIPASVLDRDKINIENDNDLESSRRSILDYFLTERGMDGDLIENFNSFTPDFVMLMKNMQPSYVDKFNRLHKFTLQNIRYNHMKSNKGFVDPKEAIMHPVYSGEYRCDVLYEIKSESGNHQHVRHGHGLFSYITKSKDNYDTLEFSTVHKDIKLMDMPILLMSKLCMMSTPFANDLLYQLPYMKIIAYIEGRNFKVQPMEETIMKNIWIPKMTKEGAIITIRNKYENDIRRHRTNATLTIKTERKCKAKPRDRKVTTSNTVNFKGKNHKHWLNLPRFVMEKPYDKKKNFSLVTLAMMFGWSPEDFINLVRSFLGDLVKIPVVETILQYNQNDTGGIDNRKDALLHMYDLCDVNDPEPTEESKLSYVAYYLSTEYFCQFATEGDDPDMDLENDKKVFMLAEAMATLIKLCKEVTSRQNEQDKYVIPDELSFVRKRFITPGKAIAELIRMVSRETVKSINRKIAKTLEKGQIDNIENVLTFSNYMKITRSIHNGVFTTKSGPNAPDSSCYKTQTFDMGLGGTDYQYINSNKVVKMKVKSPPIGSLMVRHSQAKRVDPYATPDSNNCGSVRFRALGAFITPFHENYTINRVILMAIHSIAEQINFIPFLKSMRVTPSLSSYVLIKDVYGGPIGWCSEPLLLYQHFCQLRRSGNMDPYLTLWYDRPNNFFVFNCDENRLLAPFLVVDNLPKLLQIMEQYVSVEHNSTSSKESVLKTKITKTLLTRDKMKYLTSIGCIEYLDASEEYSDMVYVADTFASLQESNWEQTHMDIHGILNVSLGVAKAFFNHDQGPRCLYTANQENQSLPVKIHDDQGTSMSRKIFYGQKPIISNPIERLLGLRENEPNAVYLNVALYSLGPNMEDAVVFKKSTLERGFGMTSSVKTYKITLSKKQRLGKANDTTNLSSDLSHYRHIGENGLPCEGQLLEKNDVVIGIIAKYDKDICNSIRIKGEHKVRVISTEVFQHNKGPITVLVRTESIARQPGVGDKFHVIHGQKFTASRIVNDEDLPFSLIDGTTPDAFLSTISAKRITLGMMYEGTFNVSEILQPGTIEKHYNQFYTKEQLAEQERKHEEIMRKHGYSKTLKQKMCCGISGEIIENPITVLVLPMRTLKHQAKDKIRYRRQGRVDPLTRQTTNGKAKGGGLKMGTMEKRNGVSVGASAFVKNFNFDCADKFMIYYCTACSMDAIGTEDYQICTNCHSCKDIVRVYYPYISHLIKAEMGTINAKFEFEVEKMDDEESLLYDKDKIIHEYNKEMNRRYAKPGKRKMKTELNPPDLKHLKK